MERKGKERNIQTRKSFHFVILMENMMEGHIIKRLVLTLNVENLAILFKIVQKWKEAKKNLSKINKLKQGCLLLQDKRRKLLLL